MDKNKILKAAIVLVIIIILLGVAIYSFMYFNQLQLKESNADHRKRILLALGKVMVLPEYETPDVLSIKEKNETLAKIAIFRKAKTGHEIIIYPRYHKKAILFDPKSNKIVDILPIRNLDGQGSVTEFGDLGTK